MKYVCIQCGYLGNPRKKNQGSILIEIILWICFLIPGLIYSIWRLGAKYDECPNCKAIGSMIPENSPNAKKIFK